MARPVRQLVERCSVISGRVLERLFGREMNTVAGPAVECPVALIVADLRAGVVENSFARAYYLKGRRALWLILRHSVDLTRVEDCIDAVNEPLAATAFVIATLPVSGIVALGCFLPGSRLHFPELDLRTFFSPAYLTAMLGSLFIRHPARVVIAALKSGRHQMNGIAAPVIPICNRVPRHCNGRLGGIPRLLPRSHAPFEH